MGFDCIFKNEPKRKIDVRFISLLWPNINSQFLLECGHIENMIEEVTRWKDTNKGQWPWVVTFTSTMNSWFQYDTTIWGVLGVILSNKWVLTAGHSLDNRMSYRAYTNDGNHYEVSEIIPYSSCDPRSTQCKNDIALVKLSSAITFADNVRSICIPRYDIQQSFLKNRSEPAMILTNLGMNGLRMRSVRVHRARDCIHYSFSSHMICAGSLQGGCAGDSGSPLVFSREADNHYNKNKKYTAYLGGILSWGQDILHDDIDMDACHSDPQFLAYTNIAKKLKWITEKTGITAA